MDKPRQISEDPFKSAKWDEITAGRSFRQSDAPVLALLCQWYAVIEKCIEDITCDGSVHVAYQNDIGDVKAMPQLSTMKQASAEIRAINKQLGIDDEVEPEAFRREATVLEIVRGKYKDGPPRAEGAHRAG